MAARDNRKNTDKTTQADADTTPADAGTPDTGRDTTGRTWLVNHGTTPMVYDKDGRTLPAGGRVEAGSLDDTGRAAVERGFLSLVETGDDEHRDAGKPEATGPGAPTGD